MPMRGELLSPTLRPRRSRGIDESAWRDFSDALIAIDPGILIFSGAGLLANLLFVLLDPSSALEIAAAVAPAF